MRFQASLLSSLCLFLVPTWPQCQEPPLQGTKSLWNRMFPTTRAAPTLPQIPGGWRSGKECHLGWLADVKGCGWRADDGISAKWLNACPHQRHLAWPPKPHLGSAWPGISVPGTPSSQRRPFSTSPPSIFLVPPLSQDPFPGVRRSHHIPWQAGPPGPHSLPKHQELVWLGAWTIRPVILNPLLEAGPGLPASSPPLHTLDSPFLPQFLPAPEMALGSWQRVVADVTQADSDGRAGMAGSFQRWHQRG